MAAKRLYDRTYAITVVKKTGPRDGKNHAVKIVGGRAVKGGGN